MKTKKSYLPIFFSIIFSFLLNSCSESSLSDVELTDPGLIRAQFNLEISKGENDNTKYFAIAYLFDKNDNRLTLNNGKVLINSTAMRLRREQFTNLPYYDGYENISGVVQNGTNYTFDIELSNGQRYQSVIITQNKILTTLNVPPVHSKSENMLITWEEVDATQHLRLTFYRTFRDSNGTTTNDDISFTIPNHLLSAGNYVLNRDFFKMPNIIEGRIKLSSVKNGNINPSLMNGSQIKAEYWLLKKVLFIN